MTNTVRELDRKRDRRSIEAIDTSFEAGGAPPLALAVVEIAVACAAVRFGHRG